MSSPIEFWFDYASPYGYLASRQIGALAARYGRGVRWRPLLLSVTVGQVMGVKPLMETPMKAAYCLHDVPRMAALTGAPLVPPKAAIRPAAAARATAWLNAHNPDAAPRFGAETYAEAWERRGDIASRDTLGALADKAGINPVALAEAVDGEEARALLAAEIDEAVSRDIFGSPFFVVDGEPIWGGDRLWMVEHWLEHGAWAKT